MLNLRILFMHAMQFAFPQTAATPVQQRKHDRQMTGALRKPYKGRPNRYTPHQGARETLRRRIGGFAGVSNLACANGITRAHVAAYRDGTNALTESV